MARLPSSLRMPWSIFKAATQTWARSQNMRGSRPGTMHCDIARIPVDGQQPIAGTFAFPDTGVPGILFLHGWAGSQDNDLRRAQDIAALGCICLTFDLRGHGGTETLRQTITPEKNLEDALAAYDLLVAQPAVDKSAVAVVGSSYGAYLATILSILRPVKWLSLRAPSL